MRPAARHLLTLLTLALALVLPLRAAAAIVPVCEDEAMSVALIEGAGLGCTLVAGVDEETGEAKGAPICDPRGASAVAPPRILPVSEARIDAGPGCSGSELGPALRPLSHDPVSTGELASHTYQAVVAPVLVVPPALRAPDALPPTPVEGGPRSGFARGIDHPPR